MSEQELRKKIADEVSNYGSGLHSDHYISTFNIADSISKLISESVQKIEIPNHTGETVLDNGKYAGAEWFRQQVLNLLKWG